ncbi:ABC transporter [Leptolinea sp. HRD-7]|nr:ABC transporter [Leptolinea sp. HRD-7]
MNELHIQAKNLSKTYRVPVRHEGLGESIRSLLRPTYDEVPAVKDISFDVSAGEMVGFIGPNGAGKTTTLKMLSGLVHPTSGDITVLGHKPWKREADYLRRISIIMGNKSQMLWDIPPMDSFRVLSEIYNVPAADYKNTLDEIIDLLDMKELLTKPVRNLSLGERMKCELTASLLYRPAVLFLDEPTLGLDVSMQLRLRRFLADYNKRSGVTVILTSHYMADVTALCERVILIHNGSLMFDGALSTLAHDLSPYKLLRLTLLEDIPVETLNLPAGAEVTVSEEQGEGLSIRVPRADAPAITAKLLQTLPVADLTVEDPPIEAVIDRVYSGGLQ